MQIEVFEEGHVYGCEEGLLSELVQFLFLRPSLKGGRCGHLGSSGVRANHGLFTYFHPFLSGRSPHPPMSLRVKFKHSLLPHSHIFFFRLVHFLILMDLLLIIYVFIYF